jgi:hypothetical protein
MGDESGNARNVEALLIRELHNIALDRSEVAALTVEKGE